MDFKLFLCFLIDSMDPVCPAGLQGGSCQAALFWTSLEDPLGKAPQPVNHHIVLMSKAQSKLTSCFLVGFWALPKSTIIYTWSNVSSSLHRMLPKLAKSSFVISLDNVSGSGTSLTCIKVKLIWLGQSLQGWYQLIWFNSISSFDLIINFELPSSQLIWSDFL